MDSNPPHPNISFDDGALFIVGDQFNDLSASAPGRNVNQPSDTESLINSFATSEISSLNDGQEDRFQPLDEVEALNLRTTITQLEAKLRDARLLANDVLWDEEQRNADTQLATLERKNSALRRLIKTARQSIAAARARGGNLDTSTIAASLKEASQSVETIASPTVSEGRGEDAPPFSASPAKSDEGPELQWSVLTASGHGTSDISQDVQDHDVSTDTDLEPQEVSDTDSVGWEAAREELQHQIDQQRLELRLLAVKNEPRIALRNRFKEVERQQESINEHLGDVVTEAYEHTEDATSTQNPEQWLDRLDVILRKEEDDEDDRTAVLDTAFSGLHISAPVEHAYPDTVSLDGNDE